MQQLLQPVSSVNEALLAKINVTFYSPQLPPPVAFIGVDSRLRELECSLLRHKVPCITTLVTTLLGVPIFTSYQ